MFVSEDAQNRLFDVFEGATLTFAADEDAVVEIESVDLDFEDGVASFNAVLSAASERRDVAVKLAATGHFGVGPAQAALDKDAMNLTLPASVHSIRLMSRFGAIHAAAPFSMRSWRRA